MSKIFHQLFAISWDEQLPGFPFRSPSLHEEPPQNPVVLNNSHTLSHNTGTPGGICKAHSRVLCLLGGRSAKDWQAPDDGCLGMPASVPPFSSSRTLQCEEVGREMLWRQLDSKRVKVKDGNASWGLSSSHSQPFYTLWVNVSH